MKNIAVLLFLLLCSIPLIGQPDFYDSYKFTEADTLRGMMRPERSCYDVTFYELELEVDPKREYLTGFVDIHFRTLEDFETLQIDLYENMQINSIEFGGKELD